MIEINNNKFARNDSEFTETLFTKKTAYGYYKKLKGRIHLMDMQRNVFAAIVCNSHDFVGIVNANRQDNGQVFYQHAASENIRKLLGVPEGYIAAREYAQRLFNAA